MVKVTFSENYEKAVSKIKDVSIRNKLIKLILKIRDNPEIGKPMRYERKGTREVYIVPFRLSYKVEGYTVYILALYHKDLQ